MSEMNDRDIKVMFRSAMGGYKKEDVNSYILSENRRFAEMEKAMMADIDALRRELDAANAKIAELEKVSEDYVDASTRLAAAELKNSELQANLQKRDDRIAELELELEEKAKVEAELREAVETGKAEAERARAEADEKLTAAKAELDSAKASAVDAAAEYEAVIAQLTEELACRPEAGVGEPSEADKAAAEDLLTRAKIASEEVLRRAEEGAGVILDRARSEAHTFRSDIFNAAKEMFSAVAEELRRSIGICMSDFVSGMKSAKNDTARAADEAGRCDDDLSRRIERMQNDLDRAIAEKLAEFDRKHGDQ